MPIEVTIKLDTLTWGRMALRASLSDTTIEALTSAVVTGEAAIWAKTQKLLAVEP